MVGQVIRTEYIRAREYIPLLVGSTAASVVSDFVYFSERKNILLLQ